jgi:hypothetical protein
VIVWRVFPSVDGATDGQPGHPLYVHPDQGAGRWDNPDRYLAFYAAASAEAAVGEAFAHLLRWTADMLPFPQLPGAVRVLGVYRYDEEAHPLLDLDDARALLDRGLRPTDVVVRNRPRTQAIARGIHDEGHWAGVRWWSVHRPQWPVMAFFGTEALTVEGVVDLPGHPAVRDAAAVLVREVDPALR